MSRIALRHLPDPDCLEFSWPDDCVCVVHGHGGALAGKLSERLVEKGWQVVLLTGVPAAATDGVPMLFVNPADASSLDKALQTIGREHGRVAAYIEIGAPPETPAADLLSQSSKAALKSAFLGAKSLMPLLTDPALPRAWHVTVNRFDGSLGLAGSDSSTGRTGGGIFGLSKTLGREWPSVSCRSLDLHPDFTLEEAVDIVVDELFDPDSSVAEIGRRPEGRFTIAATEQSHA